MSFYPEKFDIDNYLTEETLGVYLKKIFKTDFIRDKTVPDSGLLTRPDYRSDKLRLIVEFDGHRHFTDVNVIIRDQLKDETYTDIGYRVVRIPYFVQLETRTIKDYFGIDYQLEQEFPHGFIVDNQNLVLPANYCEIGILNYIESLKILSDSVRNEIFYSLKVKHKKLKDERLVLPTTLLHQIDFTPQELK